MIAAHSLSASGRYASFNWAVSSLWKARLVKYFEKDELHLPTIALVFPNGAKILV